MIQLYECRVAQKARMIVSDLLIRDTSLQNSINFSRSENAIAVLNAKPFEDLRTKLSFVSKSKSE